MAEKPLVDRIALVTGASRGIGYAAALALARAGAHIVAVARTVGGLEELDDAVRAEGGTATLVPLDLDDFEGVADSRSRSPSVTSAWIFSSAMPACSGRSLRSAMSIRKSSSR